MKPALSTKIGETLAHIQDFFDSLIHFGVKRAKEVKKEIDESRNGNSSVFGKLLGFISEMGDSFYNKYTEIKSEKERDKEN